MPTRKTKKDDTASPEKGKSLETAISQIETQFGPGTIMRMGEREVQSIPSISTCLLYTSPSPRDKRQSRMPSSA